jgi:restriction system protein
MLLDWLQKRSAEARSSGPSHQGLLWTSVAYQEDAPAVRSDAELEGAFEHLEYAVQRRFQNQLTRAERARLDNTIDNALFKVERYVARLEATAREVQLGRCQAMRDTIRRSREQVERLRDQARRADLKLKELASLNAATFEEFVAELFEALGYEVEQVGGSGDEGADLRVRKGPLLGVVQCKYSQGKAVVGSPDLQKFLGTIHHTGSHKGFFVTTRTFSLAAERFVAEHPIELIDGPRLVELVQQAIGPGARRDPEPAWF